MNSYLTSVKTAECELSLCLQQGDKQSPVILVGDLICQDSLLLMSEIAFAVGESAELSVNCMEQELQVSGQVTAVISMDHGFHVSLGLEHEDTLRTRMLLQMSEIEQYRESKACQGIHLSFDQAACEWVDQYAESFAAQFDQ